MPYCSLCGKKVFDVELFCNSCGAPINNNFNKFNDSVNNSLFTNKMYVTQSFECSTIVIKFDKTMITNTIIENLSLSKQKVNEVLVVSIDDDLSFEVGCNNKIAYNIMPGTHKLTTYVLSNTKKYGFVSKNFQANYGEILEIVYKAPLTNITSPVIYIKPFNK